eukprot:208726-Heterocapsa_arctica.AAC.1
MSLRHICGSRRVRVSVWSYCSLAFGFVAVFGTRPYDVCPRPIPLLRMPPIKNIESGFGTSHFI